MSLHIREQDEEFARLQQEIELEFARQEHERAIILAEGLKPKREPIQGILGSTGTTGTTGATLDSSEMQEQRRRGRHLPESKLIMPNEEVTYITNPNPTDCVCKKRAVTVKVPLRADGKMSGREYGIVKKQMEATIKQHQNNIGGVYRSFHIVQIHKLKNCCLWKRYNNCHLELTKGVGDNEEGDLVERLLFHGSPQLDDIINKGFDERYSAQGGYFGAGIYFASHSSKSNQYVMGFKGGNGCPTHKDNSCYICERKLLLCRVLLGKIDKRTIPEKMAHPKPGFHSVEGVPSAGYLQFPEFVVYRGEQAYPEYLVTYKILK